MKELFEQYGEMLLGIISAIAVIGLAFLFFTDGGIVGQKLMEYGSLSL